MDYKYIRSIRSRKKAERDRFYTNDLTHIVATTKSDMLLVGDFNYTLETNDSTGKKHFSRALASIVNELDLHDVWNATSTNKGYTHYASKTASRLDRIYVTKHLRTRKTSVETIATTFTDHFAVVLRLAIDEPLPMRGRGYWKMNVSLLTRCNIHERGKNIMDKMAATQEVLSQYRHVVG